MIILPNLSQCILLREQVMTHGMRPFRKLLEQTLLSDGYSRHPFLTQSAGANSQKVETRVHQVSGELVSQEYHTGRCRLGEWISWDLRGFVVNTVHATICMRCRTPSPCMISLQTCPCQCKSPTEIMYCEPLNNTASIIVMGFLLSKNMNNPPTENANCAYSIVVKHRACRYRSVQSFGRSH
jgi:hypothetical protein